ncbi:Villin-4 [Rhynchospora pubera]|uniref:Villin-4 n=1 Tax=Rhynchospora pubera TaxID=906938 RepID=A0AAV8H6S3_9POAL|nr:Villin-4 [Rhynchospora pubera]
MASIKHTYSSLIKQKSQKSTRQTKANMAVSMRDLDPAFQGAGQKAGLEIWRIENSRPVLVPKSSHGKFFMGDAYIILKTAALKNGSLRHDIHYWLGKDTTQDDAGTAAVITVELDAALGGRAVQYREVQGNETEKFLSYFKPCIIPQKGGAASGSRHADISERDHVTRLFVCRGKHVVHVKEVPFARSSLNHDDIFILDTKSKIFQFNGSNTSIQERAKALEVVQYIKETYHAGKCGVAAVEDGKLMADADAGEFWGFFGGFAPLPRKAASSDDNGKIDDVLSIKLLRVSKGQMVPLGGENLTRETLETNKCYLLDCGSEIFVWMGRDTSLEARKSASGAAEELLREPGRPKANVIRIIEGFETAVFKSKFDRWPQAADLAVSEEGRGKVAALLRRQGLNVKGLLKATPIKEDPQPFIDCTGNLQVWRVNGKEKSLLSANDQFKFYQGDCYIFQYTYSGEEKDEYIIGTWFGKRSTEEERNAAISLAYKIVESVKFQATQARLYDGKEPIQFFVIFQTFIVYKGGLSSGYKNFISENAPNDETYLENGLALFRIQGTGPENMQAIQVDPVASSLNSSYCYILHNGNAVFTWTGSLTTTVDQELAERMLDLIKPNMQSKVQREGSETEQFWYLLGGKSEYPGQKLVREPETDPHLFSCSFSKGKLKVNEIFNFTQDDLMTEDVFILDCHSYVCVWVGQQVHSESRSQALSIGEKFVENDVLMENFSRETPIYVINEGCEPPFFTRFFTWNPAKFAMHGNSFQRKLAIVKNGVTPTLDKPKRRTQTASHTGRSSVPDNAQGRSSRSMSFSPDRVRVRGRSPAFNALAANFEKSDRNLSTPPPVVRKLHPRSLSPDPSKIQPPPKSAAIAALSSSFEKPPPQNLIPRVVKVSPTSKQTSVDANNKTKLDSNNNSNGKDSLAIMSKRLEALSIQEDVKEGEPEDEEGLTLYPYLRLITTSNDPAPDIDVTKRETYLSSSEFRDKFRMTKEAFAKLPKWKQNRLKMALLLF